METEYFNKAIEDFKLTFPRLEDDRYEDFISIREHPKYKDTYIVVEQDSKKGSRISQINSKFDANIRTDKSNLYGAKI